MCLSIITMWICIYMQFMCQKTWDPRGSTWIINVGYQLRPSAPWPAICPAMDLAAIGASAGALHGHGSGGSAAGGGIPWEIYDVYPLRNDLT